MYGRVVSYGGGGIALWWCAPYARANVTPLFFDRLNDSSSNHNGQQSEAAIKSKERVCFLPCGDEHGWFLVGLYIFGGTRRVQ